MSETQIRVLTLNCWGLKYVAKHRAQRINAIAAEIAEADHDIVGLQELWVFSDYQAVRNRVTKRLPYSKLFYSGALGAGLAVFSRYPIIASTIRPYSLNGSPIDVIAGDWFVGKAAACVTIQHPILGEVDVFNTHLFARGGEDTPEHRRAHRLVNAWEFAKDVRSSADRGRYVIATGDFNAIPGSLPMAIILGHAGLTDVWDASHSPLASTSTADTSPGDAIVLFGVTADSPLNSYSAAKPLDMVAQKHQGKRLDYIFYRHPTSCNASQPFLECKESQVVFTSKIPGSTISFSDHFGLEATFTVVIPPHLDQCNATFRRATDPSTLLPEESITRVLHAFVGCYRLARSRSQLQLATFAVCLAILLALVVSSAFLPRSWIHPLFVLLTIAVSWLATTMLYIGFVWGNWEARALTSIIEELELLRDHQRRLNGHADGSG